MNAQKPSVGVKSFCRAWNGIGIESEYITFKEPHVVAVKMTKGPWLFREFAATWRFQDEGTLTHLTFIYHFRTRFVPEMVVGFILKREMRRRLQDLKNYGESVK